MVFPLHFRSLILNLVLSLAALSVQAQEPSSPPVGELDSSFGSGGITRPVMEARWYKSEMGGMTVQRDGKIVLVGTVSDSLYNYPSHVLIIRLNTDGSLDSSFGNAGMVITYPPSGSLRVVKFVREMADGRLLVAGRHDNSFFTLQLSADGVVNRDYGPLPIRVSYKESLKDFALLPNGQALVLSQLDQRASIGLYRLNLDGTVDTTFVPGNRRWEFGGSSRDRAGAIAVRPDGRILVGYSEAKDMGIQPDLPDAALNVRALLPDGTVDLQFRDPRTRFPRLDLSPTAAETVQHLNLDAEGNLLLLGHLEGEENNLVLARYTVSSLPDMSWGNSGLVQTRLGQGAVPLSTQVLPDGRVLVMANEASGACLLARFEWNGRLDTSFGNACVLSTPAALSAVSIFNVIQHEGRLLLAGNAPAEGELITGLSLARVHAGAALPAPEITLNQPLSSLNVTMMDAINMTVDASGPEGMVYSWYRGDRLIHRSLTPNYHVPYAVGVDEGTYHVELRHGVTAVRSETFDIHVNQAAQITPPYPLSIFEGAQLDIRFGVRARKPMTVKWYHNDVEIREDSHSGGPAEAMGETLTLQLPAITKSDAGHYHMVITNADGTVTSGKVLVTVGNNPSVDILDAPGGYVVAVGDSLMLQPSINSTESYTLQWFKNGKAIPGAKEATFLIQNADFKDSGSYTVRISSRLGKGISPPMMVSVAGVPNRKQMAIAGQKFSIAIPAKDLGIHYQWYHNDAELEDGNGISGTQTGVLTFDPVGQDHAGSYYCILIQGGTLMGTELISLDIASTPPVQEAVTLPAAQMGRPYEVELPQPANTSQFEIRGLPPGLQYHLNEGRLSGLPLKSGSYPLTFIASNPLGKAEPVKTVLVVQPFPTERTGRFFGTFTGQDSAGSLDVTVTATGSYSGKFSLTNMDGDAAVIPLKGHFLAESMLEVEEEITVPTHVHTAETKPNRLTKKTPFFDLDLNLTDDGITAQFLFKGLKHTETLILHAPRCPWTAKAPLHAAVPGDYHLYWLRHGAPGPDGHGYGRATIKPAGSFTLVGKLVDDTAVTLSVPVAADLSSQAYAPLYKGRGALTGSYSMGQGSAAPAYRDTLLRGEMTWHKHLPAAGQKVYPHDFTCQLQVPDAGKYQRPRQPELTGPLALNAPESTGNVQLHLMNFTEVMTLKPNQTLDIASATGAIAGLQTLSFNVATGLFTGRGTLEIFEEKYNPKKDLIQEVLVRRPYTIQGLIVFSPDSTQGSAQGFALQPILLPREGAPAIRVTTPTPVSITVFGR